MGKWSEKDSIPDPIKSGDGFLLYRLVTGVLTSFKFAAEDLGIFTRTPLARGYYVYMALISQASSSADPTVIELQETLVGSAAWTRMGVGSYRCTLTGAFPNDKVLLPVYDLGAIKIPISSDVADLGYFLLYKQDGVNNYIQMDVVDTSFARIDLFDLIGTGKLPIEFKVFL